MIKTWAVLRCTALWCAVLYCIVMCHAMVHGFSRKSRIDGEAAHVQAAAAAVQQAAQAQAGASGQGQSSATALQLVKVLQQQVGNLEGRLTAQEKKRKELKKVCRNCQSPVSFSH